MLENLLRIVGNHVHLARERRLRTHIDVFRIIDGRLSYNVPTEFDEDVTFNVHGCVQTRQVQMSDVKEVRTLNGMIAIILK